MSVEVGRWKGSNKAGSTRLCSGESSSSFLRGVEGAGGAGVDGFAVAEGGPGVVAVGKEASSSALWARCLLLSSTCFSAAFGRIFSPTSAR